ncbi:MAG TPA: hypothetical protein VIT91_20200 [Chthoniobacterales bacterium]
MKITCVENDADGRSRFREWDIPLVPSGDIGALSALVPVTGVIFRETGGDYDYDWHRAPQRQFIVLLDGEIEIETGSGEIRRFRGGEILLVSDTEGRGHRTRSVDGRLRRSLFLPLAPAAASP